MYEKFFAFHNSAARVYGGAAGLFLVLSTVIAIVPALQAASTPPSDRVKPYSAAAAKGRQHYIAEGCAYCHTQQVRPVPGDKLFGPPSVAGDYAYDQPHLLGTERTGPDLSNVGVRQPNDTWHLIHLWNPRAVVKESVMPSYPWYFTVKDKLEAGETQVQLPPGEAPAGKVVVAKQEALELVAYLKELKRTGASGGQQALGAGALNQGSAQQAGAKVFAANCASCHQTGGGGVPGVFPKLDGDPLVTAQDPMPLLSTILDGVQGREIGGVKYAGQMPAFKDVLTPAEVAAVATFIREAWSNKAPAVTTEQVIGARHQ
jgi:cytochrome c oxidase cbb3-type subunit 2